jgi:SagB-type dehydrogenase family enzyme
MPPLRCRQFLFLGLLCAGGMVAGGSPAVARESLRLPEPAVTGERSLEELLQQRRSVRDYRFAALAVADLGQLLWAAQGITHPAGLRTAPSAGARYPLELYVVAGDVTGLPAGVYHYRPDGHRLDGLRGGDLRAPLAQAAHAQDWLRDAAAVVVFAADYARTTRKYGDRGVRYVHMEVGHAAQNLLLQAQALGLATVVVGAFDDDALARLLRLPDDVQPLALLPVGRVAPAPP